MRQNYDSFDRVMASLKKEEPSVSFEARFREALRDAISRKHEDTILENALKRIALGVMNLKNALVPEPLVLIRAAATFIIVISAGFYVYTIQPSCPVLTAKEGVIMVQGMKGTALKEAGRDYKFRIGDIVTARKASQADIVLANKYAIRLKEGSSLRIAKLTPRLGNGRADFRLTEGKVLVSVEPGFKGSQFIVDTKTATATALGTRFSVDVSRRDMSKTQVNVAQGKVKVASKYSPENIILAKLAVTVDAGQKTQVLYDGVPAPPSRLLENEWEETDELYQIGRKPQVMLLLKNSTDRTSQLLAPCAIFISDEKPREIPALLEDAVLKTAEAIKTGDAVKHLESIKLLERIVKEYPNPKYDVQFMLYIGAYYEYLSYHKEAIKTFEKVLLEYPDSPLASMAQCAIGIIYDEKLDDARRAKRAYGLVLRKYPNSLETIWVEKRLGKGSPRLTGMSGVRG